MRRLRLSQGSRGVRPSRPNCSAFVIWQMTTNAIDKRKRVIASDSRWSIPDGDFLIYVDDTGFDKIADRHFAAILCAGDAILIEEWKNWFREPALRPHALPRTERRDADGNVQSITISLIQKPDCKILFSSGWYLDFEDVAKFSGSGAVFARDCYMRNRCGKTSIESAAAQDFATGGETKYVELETFKHNLHNARVTLAEATQQLLTKGQVVDTRTKKVVSLKEYQASAGGVVSAIIAGEKSLSAPTGQAQRPWSDAEKEELRRAMEHIAALEQAANS